MFIEKATKACVRYNSVGFAASFPSFGVMRWRGSIIPAFQVRLVNCILKSSGVVALSRCPYPEKNRGPGGKPRGTRAGVSVTRRAGIRRQNTVSKPIGGRAARFSQDFFWYVAVL